MKAFLLINSLISFEQIKALSPELFKRYCGVKPDTFAKLCDFVQEERTRVEKKPGRPCDLSVEDQVLLTLEYWREYPTRVPHCQTLAVVGGNGLTHHCQNRKSAQELREFENAGQENVTRGGKYA